VYENVLVPTDGSPSTDHAVRHALDLAQRYGARLHALYVVDTAAVASLETGSEVVLDSLHEEGERAVERVATAAADAGVEAETHVVTGPPARRIVSFADDEGMDLVVMATHGRRGVERFLLGSVTERVVRTADVPVLTVRAPGDADGDAGEGAAAEEDDGADAARGDGRGDDA
jgi:nucleotide-binding universal stress UspA family protein